MPQKSTTVGPTSGPNQRGGWSAADASDDELLCRFVSSRDDLAFAGLVERHGSLVMGVCKRVLNDQQEAEDAFQATFLVLSRKASSIRNAATLPAWLHTTALRIALRARSGRLQRREQEFEEDVMLESHPALVQITAEHQRTVLDEELNRLPSKFRLPLFLCCIEGKSRDEAAEQLGWSLGSLKGRLERGRAMLRQRLSLRGVSLSVALALWLQSQQTAGAAVAPSLVASTVQAGTQFAVGQPAAGYVTGNALQLANGSLSLMPIVIVKPLLGSIAACLLLFGVGSIPVSSADGGGDRSLLQITASQDDSGGATLVAAFDDDDEGELRKRRDRDEAHDRDAIRDRDATRDRDIEEEFEHERRNRERELMRRELEVRNAHQRQVEHERRIEREHQRLRELHDERREAVLDERREHEERRERDERREHDERADHDFDEESDLERAEVRFRPRTEREAILYRMILELRLEVAELRSEMRHDRHAHHDHDEEEHLFRDHHDHDHEGHHDEDHDEERHDDHDHDDGDREDRRRDRDED